MYHPDADGIRRRLERRGDDELLEVLHPGGDYSSQAVDVARSILVERGVDLESQAMQEALSDLENRLTAAAEEADKPLGIGMRIFCVLLAGFPAMVVAGYNYSKGRRRRAEEALGWMIAGWVFWAFVGVAAAAGA